jgi:hypothetical protein
VSGVPLGVQRRNLKQLLSQLSGWKIFLAFGLNKIFNASNAHKKKTSQSWGKLGLGGGEERWMKITQS